MNRLRFGCSPRRRTGPERRATDPEVAPGRRRAGVEAAGVVGPGQQPDQHVFTHQVQPSLQAPGRLKRATSRNRTAGRSPRGSAPRGRVGRTSRLRTPAPTGNAAPVPRTPPAPAVTAAPPGRRPAPRPGPAGRRRSAARARSSSAIRRPGCRGGRACRQPGGIPRKRGQADPEDAVLARLNSSMPSTRRRKRSSWRTAPAPTRRWFIGSAPGARRNEEGTSCLASGFAGRTAPRAKPPGSGIRGRATRREIANPRGRTGSLASPMPAPRERAPPPPPPPARRRKTPSPPPARGPAASCRSAADRGSPTGCTTGRRVPQRTSWSHCRRNPTSSRTCVTTQRDSST